jgi:hypothetical protein
MASAPVASRRVSAVDTSAHAWLEDRGPKLYLIGMIDDACSRIHARLAMHDSTEENMRLLWSYLDKYGRPLTKADPSGKTKTPRTGNMGPGLTGGLAPSALEPVPSQRSSALLQGARLPKTSTSN